MNDVLWDIVCHFVDTSAALVHTTQPTNGLLGTMCSEIQDIPLFADANKSYNN